MRYLAILAFAVLAFCSCQKEDDLKNEIDFSNPYAIADSDDPVQHERYQIFTELGVSVYFNDTIGRQFVRNDINGNPYYRYETIDPNWLFYTPTSDQQEQVGGTFKFYYVEGQERQMKCLNAIRTYLTDMVEDMRPTLIMVADSIEVLNSAGNRTNSFGTITWENGIPYYRTQYSINFRGVLLTSIADIAEEGIETLFTEMERDLAIVKIANYTTKLNEFHAVCDPTSDYGADLTDAYPLYEPYYVNEEGEHILQATFFYYARPLSFFSPDYEGLIQEFIDQGYLFDDAWIELSRMEYAAVIGPYGFVCPRSTSGGGIYDCPSYNETGQQTDLEGFTQLALQYPREFFERYWGSYTKVMKKYNIIRDILENDMGLELE